MAAYATCEDVEKGYRELTEDEQEKAAALLDEAAEIKRACRSRWELHRVLYPHSVILSRLLMGPERPESCISRSRIKNYLELADRSAAIARWRIWDDQRNHS